MSLKRILIVEDDDLLREIYELKLAAEGFEVETAVHGVQGLRKAQRFHPHLIVLDMMMPRMNGLEFLKSFAKVRTDTVAVLVFSNMLVSQQRDEALLLGADAYLIKSEHTPASLVRVIRSYLQA